MSGPDQSPEMKAVEASVAVNTTIDTPSIETRNAPESNFLRSVLQQVQQKRDETFCVWLDEGMVETDTRTFGELWDRAAVVAESLAKAGVAKGDRVILCYNFGLQFLDAFLGCQRLGAVAVPVYPPNPMKLQEALKKLALVVGDCQAKVCLMDKTVDRLRSTTRGWPTMAYKVPRVEHKDLEAVGSGSLSAALDTRRDDEIAFLQYTSGSTGDPKGVMLTFGNIFCNEDLASTICPHLAEPSAVCCSWLPQFHDMGLLFCTLYPLARGQRQVFMSPTTFIKSPVNWLAAMSKFRCTWTIAPNFAYGLASRKFQELPADKRPSLELSQVRGLGNAAEPVRLETMREFLDVFGGYGLQSASFFPCYGLAEHTVAATTGAHSIAADPTLASMSDRSGKYVFSGVVDPAASQGRQLVDVRIVAEGAEQPNSMVGEIWLRSGSCGQGYWAMEERTEETFRAVLAKPLSPPPQLEHLDPAAPVVYMRTGDEGFIEEGEDGQRRLFVCGRAKDVIIVRGRNLYPQDVELTAETASQGKLRQNCSAAFQSELPGGEGELEAADLVCELKSARESEGRLSALCDTLAAAVRAEHGVRLRRLVLIRPRSIPKTSSGKIRRKETRLAVEAGELMRKALMVWEDTSVEAKLRDAARGEPVPALHAHGDTAPGGADWPAAEPVTDTSLQSFLAVTLAEVSLAVGVEEAEVAAFEGPVAALGLDSVATHGLVHRLGLRLCVDVSPDLLLGAESVCALAETLHATATAPQLPDLAPAESVAPVAPVATVLGADSPVDLPRSHSTWRDLRAFLATRGWRSFSASRHSHEDTLRSTRSTLRSMHEDTLRSTRSTASTSDSKRRIPAPASHSDPAVTAALPSPPLASGAAIAARLSVQLALVYWVLLSVYLCALPSIAVLERVTDIQIFPLFLFRWLVEPRASAPAVFHPWGDGNWLVLSDLPGPPKPLVSSVYVAVPLGLLCAAGTFVVALTAYVVLLKWVLLGRVQAGDYPLWGWFYWRRWVVQKHVELLSLLLSLLFQDAALLSLLYMLLGASVGSRCDALLHVAADLDFDLVRIRNRASVSGSATLLTAVVSAGVLHLRRVDVGEGAEVGPNCIVCPGSVIPACVRVAPQSVVTPDAAGLAPSGSTLSGVPATLVDDAAEFRGAEGASGFKMAVLPSAWLLCLLLQAATCVLPIVAVHELWLDGAALSGPALVAVAVLHLTLYLLSLCLFTLAAKWALLGSSLRAGARIPRGSAREVARECVHRLHGLVSRFVLCHLWGGRWIALWYRLLGARVGPGSMFSTGVATSDWDAIDIGPGCILGGGATLEASSTCPETGDRLIKGITLEEGAVCGTNAWLSAGAALATRATSGVFAFVAPDSRVPEHAFVMGRQIKERAKRAFVPQHGLPRSVPWIKEVVVTAVYAGWTVLAVWAALYAVWGLRTAAHVPGLVLFPLGAGIYQLVQLLLVVLTKSVVARTSSAGEVKEQEDVELASFGAYARLYSQMFISHCYDLSVLGGLMRGGPLANLFFRTLRARVHMDAFINSSWIYDFEQVDIGAGAAVNALAVMSPHVIVSCASARLQRIALSPGATLWPRAIALGETWVPGGVQVGPLSHMAAGTTVMALGELKSQLQMGGGVQGCVMMGVPAKHVVEVGLREEGRCDDAIRASLMVNSYSVV